MRRKNFLVGVVALLVATCGVGNGLAQQKDTDHVIQFFQWKVSQDPDDCFNFDKLGAAYIQKARETGDIAYYDLARQALEKSLALESSHPEAAPATKHLAAVFFAEHRFAEARALAQRAVELNGSDVTPYALAGDAESEMGNYDRAWELYRRLEAPANSQVENSGVRYLQETRASSKAFLEGDLHASIESMRRSVEISRHAGLPAETIAWSEFMLGENYFLAGDLAHARDAYISSTRSYSGYHRALAGLGKVAAAEGKLPEAIDDYRQAIQVIPLPAYAAALGDVYAKNGQAAEAKQQYDLVEYIGRLNDFNRNVYNRELAMFYADHNLQPDRAVALARKEFDVRHDVYTWDALAWALFRAGQENEAAEAMAAALRLGTKDSLLFFHAGLIFERVGDAAKAKDFLERAESLNPQFNLLLADDAHKALRRLSSGSSEVQIGRLDDGRQ
jgi:tetratricopeptide (TPR) repeat protein